MVFTGRCDRIEFFEGGCAVIVDYKLGRSASYERKLADLGSRRHLAAKCGELKRDAFAHGLQLSAYALMHSAQRLPYRVAGVGFLGHKDGGLSGTFERPLSGCYLPDKKNGPPLEERAEEALDAMRCAAAVLKSGRYEPCYAAASCRYCPTKGVCRKGELRGDALPNEDGEDESF